MSFYRMKNPILSVSIFLALLFTGCKKKDEYSLHLISKNLTEKQKKILQKCRAKDGKSCYDLASALHLALLRGDRKVELADIIRLYRWGCNLDWSPACHNLGVIFERGSGIPVDLERAREFYGRACRLGNGKSCYNLGKTVTLLKEETLALKYLEKGCQLGVSKSCNDMGALLERLPPARRDWKRVERAYERACSSGEPLGCYNLGRLYSIKKTPLFSLQRAEEMLRKSCSQKIGLGCYHVALLYTSGIAGRLPDYQRARAYFSRACELGVPQGCNNLAVLFHRGLGGFQSLGRAQLYYKKACEMGYKPACKNLKLFLKGKIFVK